MYFNGKTYSREDVLRFRTLSSGITGVDILDPLLLGKLSWQKAWCKNNGLHKRTKRGKRAGWHTRRKHRYSSKQALRGAVLSNLIKVATIKESCKPRCLPSMLYTNCRSLNIWKLAELRSYVALHFPSIICLTETWLDNIKQQIVNLDGYVNLFANRQDRIGGGVCMLTDAKLETTILSTHTTTTVSAAWILVQQSSAKPLIISCIYHPPNGDRSSTLEYMTATLCCYTQSYPKARYLITGDFNHLPVESICQQFGLTQLVNFPTRENNTLDLMLTDCQEYRDPLKLAPLGRNDHCCIFLDGRELHKCSYVKSRRRKVTPERKMALLMDLSLTPWDLILSTPSVHLKVDMLHDIINGLLNIHCPFQKVKIRSDRPPWITPSILKLIRARDKAFTKGCASFKLLRSLVQKAIRCRKREFIQEKLNCTGQTREWWQLVKKLTKPKAANTTSHLTAIDNEKLNNQQLADKLNNHYKQVGGDPIADITTHIHSQQADTGLHPLSIGEVKQLLRHINPMKATSKEDFPSWISFEGLDDICIPMHNIINSIFATGEYPARWKRSQITPIPKTTKPTTCKDYRPVSLLFHLGKVAEQAIINKLSPYLNNIVEDNQYAYLPKRSTTDAILQLVDDTTLALDEANCKYMQIACLDFSKAFDKLQPAILTRKLHDYRINSRLVSIIRDFLRGRQQCVRVNAAFSSYTDIAVGAPQGTKLGPILWLFYVNDLTAANVSSVKYADDTTFYRAVRDPATESITPAILTTQSWAEVNCMTLNTTKTEVMNISLSHRANYDEPIFISGNEIKPTNTIKFLGVHIDKHLTFNANVNSIITKSNSRLYLLRQLKILGMNKRGLVNFYCTNIRTVLTYASPAWFFLLSQTDQTRLEQVQRTATRFILPGPDYTTRLKELDLPPLSQFIYGSSLAHIHKIAGSPSHPLNERVLVNTNRKSSRTSRMFYTKTARTSKRCRSFFHFFMSKF
jgi:exonuclease III